MKGKLVAVVGPSGSGKNTLIKYITDLYPDIPVVVSCTTRIPREGEENGVHYHFLTREEFESRIREDRLLEWAEYGGNFYGTPKEQVADAIEGGKLLIEDMDVQGVRKVRNELSADEFVTIFIDAGPWEALAARARARAPITEEELERRKERFEDEATFRGEATYVVHNPDGGLDAAKESIQTIIAGLRAEIGLE